MNYETLNPQIFSRFKLIIAELAGVDERDITPSTNLQYGLGFDDLDYVELVMSVEEEWGIEISDEEISSESGGTKGGRWRDSAPDSGIFGNWHLQTIQDWVVFLMKRVNG